MHTHLTTAEATARKWAHAFDNADEQGGREQCDPFCGCPNCTTDREV
jgi:hypothetical protein